MVYYHRVRKIHNITMHVYTTFKDGIEKVSVSFAVETPYMLFYFVNKMVVDVSECHHFTAMFHGHQIREQVFTRGAEFSDMVKQVTYSTGDGLTSNLIPFESGYVGILGFRNVHMVRIHEQTFRHNRYVHISYMRHKVLGRFTTEGRSPSGTGSFLNPPECHVITAGGTHPGTFLQAALFSRRHFFFSDV
jgi:hypothetical protein